jgi:hypothetical protein
MKVLFISFHLTPESNAQAIIGSKFLYRLSQDVDFRLMWFPLPFSVVPSL